MEKKRSTCWVTLKNTHMTTRQCCSDNKIRNRLIISQLIPISNLVFNFLKGHVTYSFGRHHFDMAAIVWKNTVYNLTASIELIYNINHLLYIFRKIAKFCFCFLLLFFAQFLLSELDYTENTVRVQEGIQTSILRFPFIFFPLIYGALP